MKIIGKKTFVALLATALLTGCASKVSYVALLENPDGSTGKVFVKGSKGEQVIDRAGSGAPLNGSQPAEAIDPARLKRDFGDAMAARPILPERFLLYFGSGGTKLTAESEALVPRIIESANKRPGADLSVIGHSDTVGKAETNEALALQRAKAVGALLQQKGLKAVAVSIESHGKRNQLVPTPDGTPEPKNRRVEVSVR